MPASPTLAQYRTEVRRLLHDSTGKFWSDAELNDYINDGRNRCAADTGCIRSLVTGYLNPGTEQYAIGSVTGIHVVNGGSGYPSNTTLSFIGGGGSGAQGTVTVTGGVITAASVTNPGSGYTGSFSPVINQGPGAVSALTVSDAGVGYTSPPTLGFSGGGGAGAAGTCLLRLVGAVINGAPTGYTLGDLITVSGGAFARPAVLRVVETAVGGVVNILGLVDGGSYSAIPGPTIILGTPSVAYTFPVSTTGGTGTGLTLLCAWGVDTATITAPGSGYTSAPTVTPSGGGFIGGKAATVTASVGGSGASASLLATVIPATAVDILNVTPIRGNQRSPLNYMPFTEFNAKARTLLQNPQFPARWSRYGTSGGSAFLQPVPDLSYQTEFDTCILPAALVSDSDVDVLQYPYTSPVAYYAAWKAKLKQQQYGEAEGYLKSYGQKILMAQAAVMMRRVPNPLAGYSGG